MTTLTHLQRLESESIHIMREVMAEAENPVMLYSIGKDSSVMLHLAMKAFYPSIPPFPLLHVDTTWKFREMIEFRDRRAAVSRRDRTDAGRRPGHSGPFSNQCSLNHVRRLGLCPDLLQEMNHAKRRRTTRHD